MAGEIGFRPVTEADLPRLRAWMARPHWRRWWGDPDTEVGYVEDMLAGRDGTRPFLIERDGVPVGYIQAWSVAEARVEPWLTEAPWLTWLQEDAIGVDISIADAERLSRGLGSAVLRAFVARLRADGHRTIIIDPDPMNSRAIRAYERAGFRPIPAFIDKTADVLLMQHAPQETSP
jgi:aminoglycoside 6'-N-acetyltransferase